MLTIHYFQIIDLTTLMEERGNKKGLKWTPARISMLQKIASELGYEKRKRNANFIAKIRDKCMQNEKLFPSDIFLGSKKEFENGMTEVRRFTVVLDLSEEEEEEEKKVEEEIPGAVSNLEEDLRQAESESKASDDGPPHIDENGNEIEESSAPGKSAEI